MFQFSIFFHFDFGLNFQIIPNHQFCSILTILSRAIRFKLSIFFSQYCDSIYSCYFWHGIISINDFMRHFQVISERRRSSSTTSSHVFQFGLAYQALDQSSCSTTHKMLPDIGFERSSWTGDMKWVARKLVFIIRVFVVHVFILIIKARLQDTKIASVLLIYQSDRPNRKFDVAIVNAESDWTWIDPQNI